MNRFINNILIVASAKKGDHDSFEILFETYYVRTDYEGRKYYGDLFKFVKYLIKNHHDAEDICQEAFIAAYQDLTVCKFYGESLLPFRLDFNPQYQTDLDNQTIPAELSQAFQDNGTPLSPNATVSVQQKNKMWDISDGNKKCTVVKVKKQNQLNINIYEIPLPLFHIAFDSQCQTDLDNQTIPAELSQAFQDNGIPLSPNAAVSVQKESKMWDIADGNQMYTVVKTVVEKQEQLDIYKSQKGESSFKKWLYKIAYNRVLIYWRRKGRIEFISLDEPIADDEDEGASVEEFIPSPEPWPDINVIDEEKKRMVHEVIDHIPPGEREVFRLFYFEGFKGEDIADILEISHVAVRQRLTRARNHLEELIMTQYPALVDLLFMRDSWLFFEADFKDIASFAVKLRDTQNPKYQYLRKKFSPCTQKRLDEYDDSQPLSEELKKSLVDELNRLIQSACLYHQDNFPNITLMKETKEIINQQPQGEELIRINRLLLRKAYPDNIGWGL